MNAAPSLPGLSLRDPGPFSPGEPVVLTWRLLARGSMPILGVRITPVGSDVTVLGGEVRTSSGTSPLGEAVDVGPSEIVDVTFSVTPDPGAKNPTVTMRLEVDGARADSPSLAIPVEEPSNLSVEWGAREGSRLRVVVRAEAALQGPVGLVLDLPDQMRLREQSPAVERVEAGRDAVLWADVEVDDDASVVLATARVETPGGSYPLPPVSVSPTAPVPWTITVSLPGALSVDDQAEALLVVRNPSRRVRRAIPCASVERLALGREPEARLIAAGAEEVWHLPIAATNAGTGSLSVSVGDEAASARVEIAAYAPERAYGTVVGPSTFDAHQDAEVSLDFAMPPTSGGERLLVGTPPGMRVGSLLIARASGVASLAFRQFGDDSVISEPLADIAPDQLHRVVLASAPMNEEEAHGEVVLAFRAPATGARVLVGRHPILVRARAAVEIEEPLRAPAAARMEPGEVLPFRLVLRNRGGRDARIPLSVEHEPFVAVTDQDGGAVPDAVRVPAHGRRAVDLAIAADRPSFGRSSTAVIVRAGDLVVRRPLTIVTAPSIMDLVVEAVPIPGGARVRILLCNDGTADASRSAVAFRGGHVSSATRSGKDVAVAKGPEVVLGPVLRGQPMDALIDVFGPTERVGLSVFLDGAREDREVEIPLAQVGSPFEAVPESDVPFAPSARDLPREEVVEPAAQAAFVAVEALEAAPASASGAEPPAQPVPFEASGSGPAPEAEEDRPWHEVLDVEPPRARIDLSDVGAESVAPPPGSAFAAELAAMNHREEEPPEPQTEPTDEPVLAAAPVADEPVRPADAVSADHRELQADAAVPAVEAAAPPESSPAQAVGELVMDDDEGSLHGSPPASDARPEAPQPSDDGRPEPVAADALPAGDPALSRSDRKMLGRLRDLREKIGTSRAVHGMIVGLFVDGESEPGKALRDNIVKNLTATLNPDFEPATAWAILVPASVVTWLEAPSEPAAISVLAHEIAATGVSERLSEYLEQVSNTFDSVTGLSDDRARARIFSPAERLDALLDSWYQTAAEVAA